MYVVIATKRNTEAGAPVDVFHAKNRPAAKRLKYKLKAKITDTDYVVYRRVAIKPVKFVKV